MPPHTRNGSRVATLAAATLLIAAGCSGGAAVASSPSPSEAARPVATATPSAKPSATATHSPTPSRAPSARPSPSPVPPITAIDTLTIGSPYALVFNPANAALSASFNFQMGSVVVTETMTGREIHQRGKPVGLLYVLELTGVPMSDAVFQGGARGAAANSGGKLTYGTVLGHKVAYVVTKTASFAMFLRDDVIVMVGAQTLAQTKALLSAVLKSNR